MRSQNHANTYQFSVKIDWNERLKCVDESKRRKNSVSDKKIANEEVDETIGS